MKVTGQMVLAVWLIAYGVAQVLPTLLPGGISMVLGILAIIAGALILMGK